MAYRVELSRSAARDLSRIPQPSRTRIAEHIDALAAEPRPAGAKALKGELRGHLRLRVGNYRIIL